MDNLTVMNIKFYKRNIMRLSMLGFLAIVILTFTSCSKSESKINKGNADANLITAIQKASNKQNITIGELPAPSKTVLSYDYADDYIDQAKLAPELGYEVDMRCEKGPRVGEFRQAYFDLNGRHLRADHGGKGDHGDKERPDKMCFELVLPVTFDMPDDSEINIENKEDWQLIKDWYAEYPDVTEKPELQYPVDIKYRDGTVKTINSKEEMMEARKDCKDKGWHKKRCFELIYPVTFTMPDGNEIVLNSKEDRILIRQWYEDHPDVAEKPELQFPVDIKYKDGTIVTINNAEEMREAREDCKDKDNDKD